MLLRRCLPLACAFALVSSCAAGDPYDEAMAARIARLERIIRADQTVQDREKGAAVSLRLRDGEKGKLAISGDARLRYSAKKSTPSRE